MRVKLIGTYGPFVKFEAEDGQVASVPAEAARLTITPLPPESEEPRFPLGFGTHAMEEAA